MADDIVTRLRVIHCAADDLTPCGTCLPCQAADEIERLRAEVGRLRNSVDTLTNMLSEQCDMSDRYALAANKAEAEVERLRAISIRKVTAVDVVNEGDQMGFLRARGAVGGTESAEVIIRRIRDAS